MTLFDKLIEIRDVSEFAKFAKDAYIEGVIDGTIECAQRAFGKMSEREREAIKGTMRNEIGTYIDDTCLIEEMLARLNTEQ
jgi:hypothetical protein